MLFLSDFNPNVPQEPFIRVPILNKTLPVESLNPRLKIGHIEETSSNRKVPLGKGTRKMKKKKTLRLSNIITKSIGRKRSSTWGLTWLMDMNMIMSPPKKRKTLPINSFTHVTYGSGASLLLIIFASPAIDWFGHTEPYGQTNKQADKILSSPVLLLSSRPLGADKEPPRSSKLHFPGPGRWSLPALGGSLSAPRGREVRSRTGLDETSSVCWFVWPYGSVWPNQSMAGDAKMMRRREAPLPWVM